MIDGALRNPMPIILGHEAAGIVEEVGADVRGVTVGDHVVLSWNPHCGHCFYCDRDLPILCEEYLRQAPLAVQFDGHSRAKLEDGRELKHLMYLGALAEYCIVPAQQAIVVTKELAFEQACLIGCGVMTGVGAALNVASIHYGDSVMVIGCGACRSVGSAGRANGRCRYDRRRRSGGSQAGPGEVPRRHASGQYLQG